MKKLLIVLAFFVVLLLALGGWYVSANNTLVEMKGQAVKQWANVESSYQRRNDLIGNLVKTVQGAADFEKSTLTGVINARAKATSINIDPSNMTPEQIAQFSKVQSGLTGALSKLLVSVERYPDLKSNKNFLELQTQIEGTENRINVERNRFNDIAGDYNIHIKKIPTNIIAAIANFEPMALFSADEGSEKAPDASFDFK
ncbi:MAG: LemA family protein [Cellulophaga fucicola]|uniref:LemA family protein n=1 Tax=Cellulophaga sp. RHA19 TaxID=1798237 RepID=UPI000C2BA339|nr:LemA family protein [Cellulophaga sp. RHA19]PKB43274.1 LemA protein [Cellulophaga sp. RHA19]